MNDASIKGVPTLLLKTVILLIGIATLAFLIWEPHVEGVNANATTFSEVYLDDPFLAFAYVASIPFFILLFQAFTLVVRAERNEVFTQRSVKALRVVQHCATAMVIFVVIGVVWLLSQPSDDRPPILAMGVIATVGSIVIGAAAAVAANTLQHAVDMKSENELTV